VLWTRIFLSSGNKNCTTQRIKAVYFAVRQQTLLCFTVVVFTRKWSLFYVLMTQTTQTKTRTEATCINNSNITTIDGTKLTGNKMPSVFWSISLTIKIYLYRVHN
jgi:hypothetical protein